MEGVIAFVDALIPVVGRDLGWVFLWDFDSY